jgi:hypothetical protein
MAHLCYSAEVPGFDVRGLSPLQHRSILERVLHRLWCPPRTVRDLLALVSDGWPGNPAQEVLWLLRCEDGGRKRIRVTVESNFLLRESTSTSYHLKDVQQQTACRMKPDPNCLLQFGKDVNAQHKTSWLWGQRVLTRRHVVLLPRCVEQFFSDPTLRMKKPKRCWITCTWWLTSPLMPSSNSGAALKMTVSTVR